MRIISTALLFLLAHVAATGQQLPWRLVHTETTETSWAPFTHISAPDVSHVLVVGAYSANTFLRMSSDGGLTWKQTLLDTGVATALPGFTTGAKVHRAVATPTPRLALIASDSGVIFRSTNWGEAWQRIDLGGRSFASLSMTDSTYGIATQYPDRLWITTDGGRAWNLTVIDSLNWPDGYHLTSLEVPSQTHWVRLAT